MPANRPALLRLMLVWVLALALPWQGVWAATMVHTMAPNTAPVQPADAMASAHGSGCPHGSDALAPAAEGSGPAQETRSPPDNRTVLCAGCCAAPALPAAVLPALPALQMPSTVIAFIHRTLPTPWLGTPLRPPKALLA